MCGEGFERGLGILRCDARECPDCDRPCAADRSLAREGDDEGRGAWTGEVGGGDDGGLAHLIVLRLLREGACDGARLLDEAQRADGADRGGADADAVIVRGQQREPLADGGQCLRI